MHMHTKLNLDIHGMHMHPRYTRTGIWVCIPGVHIHTGYRFTDWKSPMHTGTGPAYNRTGAGDTGHQRYRGTGMHTAATGTRVPGYLGT